MKIVRWAAVAATVLMGLMNVGIPLNAEEQGIPLPMAWLIVLLGLAGFAAAYGLARDTSWGRPAVLAVGAVNLVGGVIALGQGMEGAVVGLVVAALGLVLGFLTPAPPSSAGNRRCGDPGGF